MAEGSQDYWQKALRFPMRLLAKGSRFSSTLLAEGSDVNVPVDYWQRVPTCSRLLSKGSQISQ